MDVSDQPHAPAALSPGKERRIDFIGGRVGLRTGLEFWIRDKLSPPVGIRTPYLLARS